MHGYDLRNVHAKFDLTLRLVECNNFLFLFSVVTKICTKIKETLQKHNKNITIMAM